MAAAHIGSDYYDAVARYASRWGVTRAAIIRAAIQQFIDIEDDPETLGETGGHDLAHDCDWRPARRPRDA